MKSPSMQLKKRIFSEFYKGSTVEEAYETLKDDVTLVQLTEWFDAIRQEKPIFKLREKRCICWRCVPEMAECCAEPMLKRPKLFENNRTKLPFLPLYKWSQRGRKFVEGGYHHPRFASHDGRFVYELGLVLSKGLRVVDSFTGKSSLFKQDPTLDYRATQVSMQNYSVDSMMFVESDLAILISIHDNVNILVNDMIGLVRICYASNTFCFLDNRPIDVRENRRAGRFNEYTEIFRSQCNQNSNEFKFGIILSRIDHGISFLTTYSIAKNSRNDWSEIQCDDDQQLIPWENTKGFALWQDDTIFTLEVGYPGMRRRGFAIYFDVTSTNLYQLVPSYVHIFDLKTQTWNLRWTNADKVPQIDLHFRATSKTNPRSQLQMESAKWVGSKLYCSVRLEPSKMWHILVLDLVDAKWKFLNCSLPSRFWTVSLSNTSKTLLLCSGYKLCRPMNTIDTEHYNFFRLKLGGTPEKLFQTCWAVYVAEIEPKCSAKDAYSMSQLLQTNLDSPFEDDYGNEKRKESLELTY